MAQSDLGSSSPEQWATVLTPSILGGKSFASSGLSHQISLGFLGFTSTGGFVRGLG